MTSSRLPAKVIAPVGGVPMIEMMIHRLKRSQTLSEICIATTTNESDQPLVDLAARLDVGCFRGSEEDVLKRVVGAGRSMQADVLIELTGDCPMIDWSVLDACVYAYFSEPVDYCGNNLVRTFPRGLDVQVFAQDVLEEVESLTQDPADREHVSLFIYEHPERYSLRNVQAVGRLRQPDWRWTVDTPDDLAFVRAVVERLGTTFPAEAAARLLLQEPELLEINGHVQQERVR